MNADQELAHRLKIKFGTAPNEPNAIQLEKIKRDIQALVARGITPSISDWAQIVGRYCPDAGRYSYHGADTSDLVTLMQLVTKK